MKDELLKKNEKLKRAIEKYHLYKQFIDEYNSTKSLDGYIEHIRNSMSSLSKGLVEYYEKLINLHNNGNSDQLLSHLYDRLLCADDDKNKIAEELKTLLREA